MFRNALVSLETLKSNRAISLGRGKLAWFCPVITESKHGPIIKEAQILDSGPTQALKPKAHSQLKVGWPSPWAPP